MTENAKAWDSEDAVLLQAIAEQRDDGAFRSLFDRYSPRVFVFVQRRVEDRELAREITSDVFMEIWMSAGTFRGESRISSWVFGIARFKCLEAVRRRGRFKRSRVVSTTDEVLSQVAGPHGPATRIDAREELRQIARVLTRLPTEQREALEWTVVDGLSLDEVARRQQVSRETVKTRVSRARHALRRMLGVSAEGVGR